MSQRQSSRLLLHYLRQLSRLLCLRTLAAAVAAPKKKPVAVGELPSVNLLNTPPVKTQMMSEEELQTYCSVWSRLNWRIYNVQVSRGWCLPGPVITRFPSSDSGSRIRASKITSLVSGSGSFTLCCQCPGGRGHTGKPYVGIELPNAKRQTVYLKEVLDSGALS